MSEFTKDEALAFIESMRLTLVNKVGFRWMVEKLSNLATFIESLAEDNERLRARDSVNAAGDCAQPSATACDARAGESVTRDEAGSA